jgi:ABC-type transport system substrate-binding protein
LVFDHCTLAVGWRELGSEFLSESVGRIGMKLNVRAVDQGPIFSPWADAKADTTCNLRRGNYDTAEFRYILGMDVYGGYYYSYHSEQIPTAATGGTGDNHLRFSNAEMDAALDALGSAVAPADQLAAAYRVQQIYVDQVPEVTLLYPNTSIPVTSRLQNFEKNGSTASDMWNIEDWWVTR